MGPSQRRIQREGAKMPRRKLKKFEQEATGWGSQISKFQISDMGAGRGGGAGQDFDKVLDEVFERWLDIKA